MHVPQVQHIVEVYEEARVGGSTNKQAWSRIREAATGGWSESQLRDILKDQKKFHAGEDSTHGGAYGCLDSWGHRCRIHIHSFAYGGRIC